MVLNFFQAKSLIISNRKMYGQLVPVFDNWHNNMV